MASLAAMIVYLFTLSHDILPIDAGELATVQYSLGIAHPTGYPLFTLFGHVWSYLPIPGSVIYKLNLLAALFCSVGVFFLMKTSFLVLSNPHTQTQRNKSVRKSDKTAIATTLSNNLQPLHYWMATCVGVSFAAFGTTFWAQSTGVEVYSLHIALLCAYIYTLVRFYQHPNPSWKELTLAGFTLGLCFANHMTSILLLPGSLFLIIYKNKKIATSVKSLLIWMISTGVTASLLYVYLPVRASTQPLLNWGNPVTWENFIRHVTGKQYQVWMFSSADVAKQNFNLFLNNLPNEFSFIGIAFLIAGCIYFIRKYKPIGIFLMICFLFGVIYSINYKIKDLLPYFLISFISGAMLMSGAVIWIFEKVDTFITRPAFSWLAIAIPVYLLAFNYNKVDQSTRFHIGDYTRDALQSVPSGALIFSYQWDILISPALYLQYVEGVSPDVLIVDKELLRRSWYISHIEHIEPDFFSGMEVEKEKYLSELIKFERKTKFDARILQNSFEQLITTMLRLHYDKRAIYIAPEVLNNEIKNKKDVVLPDSLKLIPQKYFYRLSGYTDYLAMEDINIPDIRFPMEEDLFTKSMKNSILTVLTDRLSYEMNLGKQKEATLVFSMIKSIREDVPPPPGLTLTSP